MRAAQTQIASDSEDEKMKVKVGIKNLIKKEF